MHYISVVCIKMLRPTGKLQFKTRLSLELQKHVMMKEQKLWKVLIARLDKLVKNDCYH